MLKVPKTLLLSLLLAGCTQTSRAPTPSPIASFPTSTSPNSAPSTPYLISSEGIGEGRLGMKLGELKEKLGDRAQFGDSQPFIVDLNAIPVSMDGEVQYYILHFSAEPLTDRDPIPFLMTDNSQYRTAEGVGPGVAIAIAEQAYGDATLYYSVENESREFVRFANPPAPNLSFRTQGSPGDFAGIYEASAETSFYGTQQFRPDSAIASVFLDGYRP
ncbi:MAG: hypothetical protein SW833_15130 [Cyanobacteriota bacterium]|nr:hypothetical protein [Cyanobacteriota bacterium]